MNRRLGPAAALHRRRQVLQEAFLIPSVADAPFADSEPLRDYLAAFGQEMKARPLRPIEETESTLDVEASLPEPGPAPERFEEFAGIRGALDQIGLSSLLWILEREHKTGTLALIVEPELETAQLHLHQGRVFRARLDHQEEPRNAELVYRLLSRTRGIFDFRPSDAAHEDELERSTTQLLFEGARRIEETRLASEDSATSVNGSRDGEDLVGGIRETVVLQTRPPLEGSRDASRGSQAREASADRSAPEPGEALQPMISRLTKGRRRVSPWREQRVLVGGRSHRRDLPKAAIAVLSTLLFVLLLLAAVSLPRDGGPDAPAATAGGSSIPCSESPDRARPDGGRFAEPTRPR